MRWPFSPGACELGAAFDAYGSRDFGDAAGLYEFARTGHGVVVHYAAGYEPRAARQYTRPQVGRVRRRTNKTCGCGCLRRGWGWVWAALPMPARGCPAACAHRARLNGRISSNNVIIQPPRRCGAGWQDLCGSRRCNPPCPQIRATASRCILRA